MYKNFIKVALFVSLFSMQGCATKITTYEPKEIQLPAEYLSEGGVEAIDSLKWWEAFGSEELNSIQEKALASLFGEDKERGNYDLQIAYTRLSSSEATLHQSKTSLFPSISGRANNSYTNNANKNVTGSTEKESSSYSLSFSLSYEVDLWGKIAAQVQASNYSYKATYEDLLTTVLTISSYITNNYIDLLAVRAELATLEEQRKLNESMVKSQELRYKYGQASSLDVVQQKEQLVRANSQKPTLLERERQLLASLALLCGELPTYKIEIKESELPILPALPQTGIPADLIENRPDIRAAKYRLLVADKNLAIAKVGYLPDISLSISQATSLTDIPQLLNNWVTGITSAIAGTIFDAGNKSAQTKKQDAAAQEAAINYVKTVSEALDEVNTALMLEIAQKEYIANLEEQYAYQLLALKESETRYLLGQDTFLRYITQLQAVQNMQTTLLNEKAALLNLRVDLYKALGISI